MTTDNSPTPSEHTPALEQESLIDFAFDYATRPLIKIIGVGGSGGNAVKNMVNKQIPGVSYLLCNTDIQALKGSGIPQYIVLGPEITAGLGAGDKPEVAKRAAEASRTEIEEALNDPGLEMVFITAGMGGGTGTGAAPVIASIAKSKGLLTVGIVSIPFLFEGSKKILKALDGLEKMKENVDALLVINNERLRMIYHDITLDNGFKIADETLADAAGAISQVITTELKINLDFADVRTTLKEGGVAIIGVGYGEGENRLRDAINQAITSPLLNNNDITRARRIFIAAYQGEKEEDRLRVHETAALREFTSRIRTSFDSIWGYGTDKELDGRIKVTILASGFDIQTTKDSVGADLDPVSRELIRQDEKDDYERINRYYPQDEIEQTSAMTLFKPVLFTEEELDDDEFIAAVEETPALSRSMSMINQIRAKRGCFEDEAHISVANEAAYAPNLSAPQVGTSPLVDVNRTKEDEKPNHDSPSEPNVIIF